LRRVVLPNNWAPRPWPDALWDYLAGGGKRAVEIAHRRRGKDDVALNYTARAAHQRVGGYWHMLPEYAQARKVIWTAVDPFTGVRRINQAFPLELRETTHEQGPENWHIRPSDASRRASIPQRRNGHQRPRLRPRSFPRSQHS
jgi:phage terminase large subunit